MQIAVLGAGYAGLVTAACLADFGHSVVAADVNQERITELKAGRVPIYEPGLDELVRRNTAAGRLRFEDSSQRACEGAAVVFLVVGTPPTSEGRVDLSQLQDAARDIASHLEVGAVVVVKSTVPVGTTRDVAAIISETRPDFEVRIATNPEFLRQGAAVGDFLHPDRVVIGVDDAGVDATLRAIYRPIIDEGVPFVTTNLETAELIKYASNAFLALKLSFINEVADLCEASSANVEDVARGIGLDARIAPGFLTAGPGFGGSCLPKDTQALLHTITSFGQRSRIVAAALEVNVDRRRNNVRRVEAAVGSPLSGKRIGVLGVTFKANTDDIRESPAIDLISGLVAAGAFVQAFDPQGAAAAQALFPGVQFVDGSLAAAAGVECLVIATEWREFATLDLSRLVEAMAAPVVVDLRNLYDPTDMAAAGIRYHSIGRQSEPSTPR